MFLSEKNNKSIFNIWKARLSSSSVPGCLFIRGFIITFNEGYFSRLFVYLNDYFKKFRLAYKSKNFAIFVSDENFEENYLGLKNRIEKDSRKVYRYIGNLYPFEKISYEISLEVNPNFVYRIVTNREDVIRNFTNLKLSKKNFDKIISIFFFDGLYFQGIFDKNFLLRKPKEEEKPICRSYYKIEEAFQVFNIKRPKKVLDLGSAPGGWVQFLLKFSEKIVAVDPAELKIKDPRILHIKKKVEEALDEIKGKAPYDMITCDINTDPREVFRILEKLFRFLNKEGSVLMTIKLIYKSRKSNEQLIREVKNLFEKYFENVEIEWLFANTKYERMLYASNLR